jgi:outer membrane protein assembly factor BamD (BamD/ComL family)
MKNCKNDVATLEYYSVRVYRRYHDDVPAETRLAGVVEDVDGHQNAFHNQEELWQLLLSKEKRRQKVR